MVLLSTTQEVANNIGMDKNHHIRSENVEGIVTACVFCDIQLTQVQFGDDAGSAEKIPVITLPQLLGPAIGIDIDTLGISLTKISPKKILEAHQ